MFELDDSFLESLGLAAMPEAERKDFLAYVQDELEVRVGEKLAEGLSEEQISEFEKLIDSGSDEGAKEWLARNRPNHKQIVEEVMEKLIEEIRSNRERILEEKNVGEA